VVVSGQYIYDWKIYQSHKAREDKLNLTIPNEKMELLPDIHTVIVEKSYFSFRTTLNC
jgi:hypothetical protein